MRTPEDRSRVVGTVLILCVLFVVFAGVLFWMYSVRLLEIPRPLAGLLGIGTGVGDPENGLDTSLSGVVRNGRPDDVEGVGFEFNYENLRDALISEPEPQGFRQTVRISYGGDESKVVICRFGDKYRVEKYKDPEKDMTEVVIFDDFSVYHLDTSSGESRSVPRNDSITPESEAGLPSVAVLTSIIREFSVPESDETTSETSSEPSGSVDEPLENTPESEIVSTQNSEEPLTSLELDDPFSRYGDVEIKLVRSDAGNVYFVAYSDKILGTREEYYISLVHNLIISQTVKYGENLLYSCETVDFSTDISDFGEIELYEP